MTEKRVRDFCQLNVEEAYVDRCKNASEGVVGTSDVHCHFDCKQPECFVFLESFPCEQTLITLIVSQFRWRER